MPPTRLSQIDGVRITVHYRKELNEAEASAHVEQANELVGVSSVWSDLSGYGAWSHRMQLHRWQSLLVALLALGLTSVAGRWIWIHQKSPYEGAIRALGQLGVSPDELDGRLNRLLGLRVAKALLLTAGLCWAVLAAYWLWAKQQVAPDDGESLAFAPRSMQIPEAREFICDASCQAHQPSRATYDYIVRHKLGLLSRQDRGLARQEQELRPWIWSLTRRPAHPAQRAVLGANLVNPELTAGFSAWKIQDAAFSKSLREIEVLAKRLVGGVPDEQKAQMLPPESRQGCQKDKGRYAPHSLSHLVQGRVASQKTSPRLQGLQDPAMFVEASRGTLVQATFAGQAAAVLRDEPGRWTLLVDAGGDWLWGLSGITALEVQSGDEIRVGDRLGEVARAAPSDEGHAGLRVELWHGQRSLDPRSCFSKPQKRNSRSRRVTKKSKRNKRRKRSKS